MAQPLAADVEMLPLPRTYTDADFTKLEARLLLPDQVADQILY